MKRIWLLFLLGLASQFCFSQSDGNGDDNDDGIILQVGYYDPWNPTHPHPKSPVSIPRVSIRDHVLSFTSYHADYVLQLRNEDVVVYETYVSSAQTTVELPEELIGEYEICLLVSANYFVGFITL